MHQADHARLNNNDTEQCSGRAAVRSTVPSAQEAVEAVGTLCTSSRFWSDLSSALAASTQADAASCLLSSFICTSASLMYASPASFPAPDVRDVPEAQRVDTASSWQACGPPYI